MTPSQPSPDTNPRPDAFRWSRTDVVQALHDFHDAQRTNPSQRQFAQQADVPRSTLQYWQQRRHHPDLEPELVAFCESPAGYRFLRRLVLALHLVFHQAGAGGLRPLGRFLELTQLDCFVAASYGTHQAIATRLRNELATFGDQERQRLGPLMAARAITLVTDENFHGDQPCLVAIEPVSNFLLVETYQDHRDADTWTRTIQSAVQGLPLEVIQITSDQAKGLLACARDGLHAQHSPDLFHDQRELTQATVLPLQRQRQAAQEELERARSHTQAQRDAQQQYEAGPRPPGRPPDFATWIQLAERYEAQAAAEVQQCQQRHEQLCAAVRGLADDYHPFDGRDGQPLTAEQVHARLQQRLAAVEAVVAAAPLGGKAQAAVSQARRWLVPLVATMAWFWSRARLRVEALALPAEAEQAVYAQLLPGLYWQQAAARGRDADQKRQWRELSERLREEAWLAGGALARLGAEEQALVRRAAQEAADLFRRSSSCVEGRNGHLSLHHHGQGPLSPGRLKALTVVHNYLQRRADGTTAAERFFGAKPRDLFGWLLERLPELPRPAAKRPARRDPRPQTKDKGRPNP